MIQVYLVDDHLIVKEGFRKLLSNEMNIHISGEAQSAEEVLLEIESIQCDVMLLDLYLPGKNGFYLLIELNKLRPDIKVIILSANTEEKSAIRAYRLGAAGYLCKNSKSDEIINAIQTVYDKGRYIKPEFAESIAFKSINNDKAEVEKLSELEVDILILLYKGVEIKDIAAKVGKSIPSIFTYKKNIFENLNFKTNLDLILFVKENMLFY